MKAEDHAKSLQTSHGGVKRSLINAFCSIHITQKQPRQAAVETTVKFAANATHPELYAECTKTNLKH